MSKPALLPASPARVCVPRFVAAPVSGSTTVTDIEVTFMTTQTQTANFNATFVDRPEVQEVFGDRIRSVCVIDGVMHIELCSTRLVVGEGDKPPTATAHTTGRWTMPVGTAVAMRDLLNQQFAEMERLGTLKIMQTAAPAPGAPKH